MKRAAKKASGAVSKSLRQTGPLSLVFLGTSSQAPSRTRNVTCGALRLPSGTTWFVDCGEATQHQARKASSVRLSKVRAVFLTHMHGDHTFGLPGLLCSISQQRMEQSGEREEEALRTPVHIVGVEGVTDYVRSCMLFSRSFLGFPLEITELLSSDRVGESGEEELDRRRAVFCPRMSIRRILPGGDGCWDVMDTDECSVRAAPIAHTVPCVGYSFEEPDVPGNANMAYIKPILDANRAKLAEKGIKPAEKLLGELKRGKVCEMPDGSVLDPKDERVVSPPVRGRKVVWMGDTSELSPSAMAMAQDADVLVHEATNAKTALDGPETTYDVVEAKAIAHGHSTPVMAGRVARSTNANTLILNHFSARYTAGPRGLGIMMQIAAQADIARNPHPENPFAIHGTEGPTLSTIKAATAFASEAPHAPHLTFADKARVAHAGHVVCSEDLMRFTLGWKRDPATQHVQLHVDNDPICDEDDEKSEF